MSKVLVNESSLTGIANAIRGKNGSTTTYKPSEMAAAITAISGGGGPDIPESAFAFSGNCNYLNYNGHWDWFFNQYGSQITLEPSKVDSWMFNSQIEDWKMNAIVSTSIFFSSMQKLKTVSGVITIVPASNTNYLNGLFNGCYSLREIPQNTFILFKENLGKNMTSLFNNCYSLIEIPEELMPYLNGTVCTSMFSGARVLSKIENFPIHSTYNYNTLSSMVNNTWRLSKFTFITDNGTPYVAEWKNHTLDLSTYTGWGTNRDYILNYNSGITADKEVTDDASYQALKNDPDWFTTNVAYSRYNHDSAVATINSLPDTSAYLASAGGTNTIKFKGDSGSATDGGEINTLTQEEIAVATAKGWSVSLV